MGNSLLRALCCMGMSPEKSRKENPNVKRTRPEMSTSEELQGPDKKSKEFPSSSYQEETSSGLEEVCYTVIDHTAHWRPSLNSNDHSYENLDATRNGDRFLREGSETEYALLRTSVEVSSSCSPEQDYELVLPH
ncbi:germinal center-associated signaling and motility-like protein isoform X2 [Fukomys damarensis]|uniref:germinal center-associated signaling and motility-like protein isoform X2 n=1 Tax=Fukomys damarensis TaxID=885580 RepID=UPI00145569D4|nr:germinal center-associated signaling and motility-like protein isoform X2 [Fukomys damarensis]